MRDSVAAVIPTYNGRALLLECLAAIIGQTHPVTAIYIVDNASSDGTQEAVVADGLYADPPAGIELFYIRLDHNGGSMGGFAEGMKRVAEAQYDWTWLVDNDSSPTSTCLQRLLEHADEGDLLGPAGLVPGSSDRLSFPLWDRVHSREIPTLPEALAARAQGMIQETVCPFHGCLLIRDAVIRSIGGIKGEMFHWGGEVEYAYRARKRGFKSRTVLEAVNHHPRYNVDMVSTLLGRRILAPAGKLHSYCFYRNNAYILWRYKKRRLMVGRLIDYAWLFLVIRRLDVRGLAFFLRATAAGVWGLWGGEKRYLPALG